MTSSSLFQRLQEAWNYLPTGSRHTLINYFLADGISEATFTLKFLPLYIQNCERSPTIGLKNALIVLIDVILLCHADGFASLPGFTSITVNVSDLADFAAKVR